MVVLIVLLVNNQELILPKLLQLKLRDVLLVTLGNTLNRLERFMPVLLAQKVAILVVQDLVAVLHVQSALRLHLQELRVYQAVCLVQLLNIQILQWVLFLAHNVQQVNI